MLTMLWILSVASIAAMTAALAGRTAVDAGRNRVGLERARWRATGCARRAQAAIDVALADAPSSEAVAVVWRTLGRVVPRSELLTECDVTFEAAGTRIDLNAATDEMIVNLSTELGYGERAQDMAAALRGWRSRPFADSRELAQVHGFEDIARFDSLVSAEPGRVSLATASAAVLMVVPGITAETADAIIARRESGMPFAALLDVIDVVSVTAADTLIARYPDAVRLTTPDPDAWLVRSRAASGLPPATEVLQWRISRVGRRAVVLQARSLR
jgi:type II secretory pathway component PulK